MTGPRPTMECEYCGGEGVVDSGGFTPQGHPINLPCPMCEVRDKERTRVLAIVEEERLRWEKLRNDNPNDYINDKQQWRIYEEHCCGAIAALDELKKKVEEGNG